MFLRVKCRQKIFNNVDVVVVVSFLTQNFAKFDFQFDLTEFQNSVELKLEQK